MQRIVAKVTLQEWVGDYAMTIGEVDVDCTDAILRMPVEVIQRLVDRDYSTDDLARPVLDTMDHAGPFEVSVTDVLCDVLVRYGALAKGSPLMNLTSDSWNAVRSMY